MTPIRSCLRTSLGPVLIGLISLAWITCEIRPFENLPGPENTPGMTSDETFNMRQGIYLVSTLRNYGLGLLAPESIHEVFGSDLFLPDHPPLGRLVLGLSHESLRLSAGDPMERIWLPRARLGSGVLFALLVTLTGCAAGRWMNAPAGIVASLMLLGCPRVFGHGHLAALETCIGLTFAATVLHVGFRWSDRPPSNRTAMAGGVLLGLALLSKVQAVLLPVPITLWALMVWRLRAIRPLAVWGVTGLAVFFVGWPWLWLSPVDHMLEYLGRTTDRIPVHVWYFGEQLKDVNVPWHYPIIMLAMSLPVPVFILGCLGMPVRATPATVDSTVQFDDRITWLLVFVATFVLAIFSIPGTAVYDGERLFLVVFPLWILLAARGCCRVAAWLPLVQSKTLRRVGFGALIVFSACWPVAETIRAGLPRLSYYSRAIGGLPGARSLELELSYWGDGMTSQFMAEVASTVPGDSTIDVVPVAHPAFLRELAAQHPELAEKGIRLRALDHRQWADVRYVLSFRRQADLPEFLRDNTLNEPTVIVEQQGVRVASLHEIDPSAFHPDE